MTNPSCPWSYTAADRPWPLCGRCGEGVGAFALLWQGEPEREEDVCQGCLRQAIEHWQQSLALGPGCATLDMPIADLPRRIT